MFAWWSVVLFHGAHCYERQCNRLAEPLETLWKKGNMYIHPSFLQFFAHFPPFFLFFFFLPIWVQMLNCFFFLLLFICLFFLKLCYYLIVFKIHWDYSVNLTLNGKSSQHKITITSGLTWCPYQQFPAWKASTEPSVGQNDLLAFLAQRLKYIGKAVWKNSTVVKYMRMAALCQAKKVHLDQYPGSHGGQK